MTTAWCPYTDRDFPTDDPRLSPEHIISLSCGGHNQFVIRVDRDRNSALGSRLDAAMANHPFVELARRFYNLPGQSGTVPNAVLAAANRSGVRGRVDLTPQVPTFQTFRSKNEYGLNVAEACSSDQHFESLFPFDLNLLASYGSKVALGASTFLFGEVFRRSGYHEHLRQLMDSDTAWDDIRFYVANRQEGDHFWVLSWPNSLRFKEMLAPEYEFISTQPDRHLIFTVPSIGEHVLSIVLFSGLFRWYLNIASDVTPYPTTGLHDLGTILELNLSSHTFKQSSMRECLSQLPGHRVAP